MSGFDKKFSNPKTSLSWGLEQLFIGNLKKLKNNARLGGECEIIIFIEKNRDIIDDNPIQIVTGAGLVFMVISPNRRIIKFDPEWWWISDIVKGGHEADCVAMFGTREVIVGKEGVCIE